MTSLDAIVAYSQWATKLAHTLSELWLPLKADDELLEVGDDECTLRSLLNFYLACNPGVIQVRSERAAIGPASRVGGQIGPRSYKDRNPGTAASEDVRAAPRPVLHRLAPD